MREKVHFDDLTTGSTIIYDSFFFLFMYEKLLDVNSKTAILKMFFQNY